jgi:hypothetical protein
MPVHVIDFPVVNVHVDELSSARIWQHKFEIVQGLSSSKPGTAYNAYKISHPVVNLIKK